MNPFWHWFSWISWFSHNQRQPPKCRYIKHLGGFSTFRTSYFPNIFQSKVQDFSETFFLEIIFAFFGTTLTPKCSILKPLWHPAVPKMAPKIAQVAPKGRRFLKGGPAFLRTCFRVHFRTAPWHRFGWSWMDFAWTQIECCIIFKVFRKHFCNKNFADCQRRLTRSDLTRFLHKGWCMLETYLQSILQIANVARNGTSWKNVNSHLILANSEAHSAAPNA